MPKAKIKSVSVLPVNDVFAVYKDEESLFKSAVIGIACIHTHDEDSGSSISLVPVEMSDVDAGFLLLEDDGSFTKPANFVTLLTSKAQATELTPTELEIVAAITNRE
jgi:hypothetical protein